MTTFSLPTKTSLHVVLNKQQADLLTSAIQYILHLEDGGADQEAINELRKDVTCRLDQLSSISSDMIAEYRNLGWSIS